MAAVRRRPVAKAIVTARRDAVRSGEQGYGSGPGMMGGGYGRGMMGVAVTAAA